MTEFTTTDRGFRWYDDIHTDYGHVVRVYESSAAREPCLWLLVKLTEEGRATAQTNIEPEAAMAHLTIEQAERVRDTLDAAIKNHYQPDSAARNE